MKANDNLPEDEMFAAKIIQNAKGRGLDYSYGALYRKNNLPRMNKTNATACCAWGAMMLERDTNKEKKFLPGLVTGNDFDNYDHGAGGIIGCVYRDVMKEES